MPMTMMEYRTIMEYTFQLVSKIKPLQVLQDCYTVPAKVQLTNALGI